MPHIAFSSLRLACIGRALVQCAAVIGMVATLAACGDGYRGYIVWGSQPPADTEDDSGLVVVITKAQLGAMHEVRQLDQYQAPLQHASAALRSALARLETTDAQHCALGATVYELVLQWPQRTERYRSNNWSCSAVPAAEVKDFISSVDLANFAQQLAKER